MFVRCVTAESLRVMAIRAIQLTLPLAVSPQMARRRVITKYHQYPRQSQRDGPMSFGHGRLSSILMVCLTICQNTHAPKGQKQNQKNQQPINS
eukprot:s188_g33.t1